MLFNFENKKVLISGGSTGIGLETVKIIIGKGAIVHSISRTKPAFEHPNLIVHLVDLYQKLPKLDNFYDLVIMNIGVNPGQKSFEELSIEEINRSIYLNLNIHLLILKTVKFDKVAFVCSVLSMSGLPNNSLYCSCKSFISTFNESLRREGKSTYIIYPYKVNTRLFDEIQDFFPLDKKEVAEVLVRDIETGRKERVLPFIFRLFPFLNSIVPVSIMDWTVKKLLKLFIKSKSQ